MLCGQRPVAADRRMVVVIFSPAVEASLDILRDNVMSFERVGKPVWIP